jgi:hypothetical protein
LTDIVDVNTADTGEFTNLPSGWSTPSCGGLNLISQDVVYALGRTTKETSPVGNVTYYLYLDPQHAERIYQGWNSSNNTLTVPTVVLREDASGTYTETFTMWATPYLTNGALDGTEAISGLQTLTIISIDFFPHEKRDHAVAAAVLNVLDNEVTKEMLISLKEHFVLTTVRSRSNRPDYKCFSLQSELSRDTE